MDTMKIMEMANAAREYRELQAMIKELEAEADALKQQMIAEMDARQVDELAAGEYTIRWTAYESNRLDGKALKEELPEIADRYTKIATSTRFQVA